MARKQKQSRPRLTSEEIAKIHDLREKGNSLSAIRKSTGRTVVTIRKALDRTPGVTKTLATSSQLPGNVHILADRILNELRAHGLSRITIHDTGDVLAEYAPHVIEENIRS